MPTYSMAHRLKTPVRQEFLGSGKTAICERLRSGSLDSGNGGWNDVRICFLGFRMYNISLVSAVLQFFLPNDLSNHFGEFF